MMKFVVSGQAKWGHESWPPQTDDKALSDRLYGGRAAVEETRMDVKFEKIGGRYVTYCHFSKFKDVTSCLSDAEKKLADHGRPGSFFVMSLRVDGYYPTDFSDIYKSLERMYQDYVDGKILKRSKDGYLVYQIMALKEAGNVWNSIDSKLKIIGEGSFLKNMKPIPEDVAIGSTSSFGYFSVDDDENDIVQSLLGKGGVIILSSDEMKAKKEREKMLETPVAVDDESKLSEKEKQVVNDDDKLNVYQDGNANENTKSLQLEINSLKRKIDSCERPFYNHSDTKKHNGLLIAAIVNLAIGELILFILFFNIRKESDIKYEEPQQIEIQEKEQDSIRQEPMPFLPKNEEVSEISRLDLQECTLVGLKSASVMEKGHKYLVIPMVSNDQSGNKTGSFSCDAEDEVLLNRDDGSVTVYGDTKVNRIKMTYEYRLGNETKSIERIVTIR